MVANPVVLEVRVKVKDFPEKICPEDLELGWEETDVQVSNLVYFVINHK